MSGTTVMLGATGILVGAVFLTSIFFQTVLGYSALRDRLAFLPFALAITVGTLVAKHMLSHPRRVSSPTVGLLVIVAASVWLSIVVGGRPARDRHPARRCPSSGSGVGMVFVPVSVTSMAGIPSSHAGMASGFLMTGHEIGAALGVAVLSAVASTAGSLTTAPALSTGSPPRSSPPLSWAPLSQSSRCCGCPPPGQRRRRHMHMH